MDSPRTGGNFGGRAVELAGIIIDPLFQKQGLGREIVQEFVRQHAPDRLVAYTRNPSILRILGAVSHTLDVLTHSDPHARAAEIPHASVHNNVIYHLDRYAPNGLYGSGDPASGHYNGQILRERCILLEDPNNALAISVNLDGEDYV